LSLRNPDLTGRWTFYEAVDIGSCALLDQQITSPEV
jgi:hypothetical protein